MLIPDADTVHIFLSARLSVKVATDECGQKDSFVSDNFNIILTLFSYIFLEAGGRLSLKVAAKGSYRRIKTIKV